MIKKGSKVSFHYTLKVEGELVDTSSGQDPLLYEHGSGQMIPGLEENVEGLKQGDKKNFSVDPEKGYGHIDPQAVQKLPLKAFKDQGVLKAGEVVAGKIGDQPFQAKVIQVDEKEVTLDLNHPLAGKILDFEVQIITVE